MKKFILTSMFLCAFIVQAQDSAQFKTETIEFIKKTITEDTFTNAVTQIGVAVPEAKKEAYVKEARGTLSGLYGKMADLYMKEFTPEEIAQLNKFYDSDIGKKLSKKQFELTQKGMQLGQNWGQEVQQIAQKYTSK
jgi:hypothetical protein